MLGEKYLAGHNITREKFSSTNVRREKLFSVANTTSSSNQNHNKDGRLWAPFLQWLTYHCHCIFLMYPFEGLCVFQCCIVNLLEACRSLHWHDWIKSNWCQEICCAERKKLRTLFDDNFVALPPLQKVPTVPPTQIQYRTTLQRTNSKVLVYVYAHNQYWKKCLATTWQKAVSLYSLNLYSEYDSTWKVWIFIKQCGRSEFSLNNSTMKVNLRVQCKSKIQHKCPELFY